MRVASRMMCLNFVWLPPRLFFCFFIAVVLSWVCYLMVLLW